MTARYSPDCSCVVLCDGQYSEVMSYAKANKLAMRYAATGKPSYVYRLIQETMYGGAKR
jgi:hypothetical protein